jgi:hypothetical protein
VIFFVKRSAYVTFNSLINTWERINKECEKNNGQQEAFFEALGIHEIRKNSYLLKCTFSNIANEPKLMLS